MKPLLAHTYQPHRINWSKDLWLQYKLNGIRALSQGGNFQSRDELPWTNGALAHLSEFMRDMFPPDWVLDGELYVHGWKLQDINAAIAVNRLTPTEKSALVEYHIFDRVSYQLPFEERFWLPMRERAGLFGPGNPIKLVESIRTNQSEVVEDYYALAVTKGYEGIMYRIGDCPYTRPKQPGHNGRSKFLSDKDNRVWHMLKRKDWQDDEFICLRVAEGEGKRSGMVGAFICETKGGNHFGVGSGLSESEAIHYYENPPVGRKIKVKFLTYTSDGVPFNPTVLAIL